MIRPQHDHLEGGFQHREPRFGRIHCEPKVARNVGEIQQLAAPGRQRAQETLKRDQVPNLAQRADVALKVSLNVTGMPERDIAIGFGNQFRISAAQEALPQIRPRDALHHGMRLRSFPRQRIERPSELLAL